MAYPNKLDAKFKLGEIVQTLGWFDGISIIIRIEWSVIYNEWSYLCRHAKDIKVKGEFRIREANIRPLIFHYNKIWNQLNA